MQPVHSFDYGDYHPVNHTTGEPFVQLLSLVDVHTAADEFQDELADMLADLAPTIEPADFVKATIDPSFLAALGLNTTSSSNSSSSSTDSISAALAEDDVDSASSSSSWRGIPKTWAIAGLALLGANLLLGAVVLAAVLTMCVRGMKGKARTVGGAPRYAPVRLKEAADAEHDEESGPLHRYSD